MLTIKEKMVVGPYKIDHVLPRGKGGMAQVCLAHSTTGDYQERIALKISRVDNGAGDRFIQALRAESEVLKQFDHPSIVKILPLPFASKYDQYMACAYDLPGGPWYYAMEYLQGNPLSSYIRGSKGLPEEIATAITLKVAVALQYMQQKGFSHLDVKSENIVFRKPLDANQRLEPVLIDFGTAAKIKTMQIDRGSLAFSPPERIYQMERRVANEMMVIDPTKVDVYALGIMYYETLTGKLPFGGFTEKGLTSAILNHVVTPIRTVRRDISIESEKLIEKMISFEPEDRPTLSGVIEELSRMKKLEGPLTSSLPRKR